jgi:dCMP deaminase
MRGTSILSNKWDKRYMELAKAVASWSKDPSKKIGAVAIGSKGQVLAQGFNGFPRGIDDNDERLNDRETKYKYVVHAEMNLIYNATFNGISLDGSTVYVYGLPICSECAKGLIQVGVKQVVMCENSYQDADEKWMKSLELSVALLNESGIHWKTVDV